MCSNGFRIASVPRGCVAPAHVQRLRDGFPGIVRHRIQILLGELEAAPSAPSRSGLVLERGREPVPHSDLLELADRKSHGDPGNTVGQIKIVESVAGVSREGHLRHCILLIGANQSVDIAVIFAAEVRCRL